MNRLIPDTLASLSRLTTLSLISIRKLNANSAAVTFIRRGRFLRHYPTKFVFPDGSTITARHTRPRYVVKIPLTLEDLKTEEEIKAFESRRIKIEKVEVKEDKMDVQFDGSQYLKMLKKKK